MTYNFHINEFEGPLDLLLHLVKASKVDIYEIKTTEIIEQYLNFIHQMEDLNIDIASEYLVMASELVHLKSRLLLNLTDEEEETEEFSINSEEDLKNKLAEYEQYKRISSDFKELEEKRGEVFTKLPESLKEYMDKGTKLDSDISLNDLLNAFMNFKKREELAKPLHTRVTKKEYSIEERTVSIRNILKKKKKINFLELFDNFTKEYVIVTLLSVLEMSKNKEINLSQKKNYGEILIEAVS